MPVLGGTLWPEPWGLNFLFGTLSAQLTPR